MKKTTLLLALLLFTVFASAQKKITRKEYIATWQLLAIEEMNRSGIPASIKMAQGVLESGDGNSELSRKSNNHFGIKCKKSWKGKKVYYDDDRKNECFRKYKTVRDSYIDHTNFLMDNPRYASLFKLKRTDYKGWARGLKKAGYATASHYDRTLIRIIEENKLYRLDKKLSPKELASYEHRPKNNNHDSGGITLNPYSSHSVQRINGLKAVVVREGDTFEMLAQELDMSGWSLYKYNDHSPGYRPRAGEVVYIQPKKNKARKGKETHRVGSGESMHFISQLYGIKLKPLYKRNGMKFGQVPQAGQVIYLRKKRK